MLKTNLKSLQLLLLPGLLWGAMASAQSSSNGALTSCGGDVSNSDGSIAFSFGHPFFSEATTSSGSLEAGIQHAYQVSDLGLDTEELGISLAVYPNPTADYLVLSIDEQALYNQKFNLINVEGEMLMQGEVKESKNQIDMSTFSSGIYFLHVQDSNNQEIKNFKIIKK